MQLFLFLIFLQPETILPKKKYKAMALAKGGGGEGWFCSNFKDFFS